MKQRPARSVVARTCSVILAVVFLVAAVPKVIDPGNFAADIQNYRILPDGLVGLAALLTPTFEIAIALALLWPRYRRGAALMATVMLVIFAGAMAQARVRGIDLSCGCFGAAFESKVSWLTVARSLLLACLGAVVLLWSPRTAATRADLVV